jgi:signal transduction histidine kinase
VEFRQSDLNQVVHDTVLLMHRQCERQKVRISMNVADLAPFRFDPEKIKQALLNITRNSLEAIPDGGEIIIATSADADHVIITISDTGPGIREADLPLIFEPFFTRKGAGTGLGLSITQRIVEEHRGEISVESGATCGTVFTLKLPLDV